MLRGAVALCLFSCVLLIAADERMYDEESFGALDNAFHPLDHEEDLLSDVPETELLDDDEEESNDEENVHDGAGSVPRPVALLCFGSELHCTAQLTRPLI